MNKASSKERLEHVKTAILYIQLFVKDQTVDDFLQDTKGQNDSLYQFLVIGEAIKNVDNAILQKYSYHCLEKSALSSDFPASFLLHFLF